MAIRVAINGYGRIGRNILRALYESKRNHEIEIVAINDLSPIETKVHLTKYDSTHGRFGFDVKAEGENMRVNGDLIHLVTERNPSQLPWKTLNVDVVYECSGFFTSKEQASAHLKAGAKKVIISAPGKDVDATIVYGVNDHILKASDTIISNASCTTNCLAPLAKVIHDTVGIESGLMVTVHAYTNDQVLLDANHSDMHRARAAAHSIIPTKTGAASAVGLVLPELNGKLDGYSLRVPVMNVSGLDFCFVPKRATTAKEIDEAIRAAANGPMKGILIVNDEPLVSVDFNHNPASSIYDAQLTRALDNQIKVFAWYDNEWGFSNRMLDVTKVWMQAK
jgi:glyceraldehyde 3-phosphate dehydrogenase